MGGRLRENCNSQSGTVQVRQQSLCGINCKVLLNSADSTKFKESCFAYDIDTFHGEIFIRVETAVSDLIGESNSSLADRQRCRRVLEF